MVDNAKTVGYSVGTAYTNAVGIESPLFEATVTATSTRFFYAHSMVTLWVSRARCRKTRLPSLDTGLSTRTVSPTLLKEGAKFNTLSKEFHHV